MTSLRGDKKFRVALLIETSSLYGRGLLEGIQRYSRSNCNWQAYLIEGFPNNPALGWRPIWNGDGILSRATVEGFVEFASKSSIPIIQLTDRRGDLGLVHVGADDHAIGKLGAEHFIDRGFTSFAFCGFSMEPWSLRRMEGFRNRVHEREFPCSIFESPRNPPLNEMTSPDFDREEIRLVEWLRMLSPPTAVMCCNDQRGHQLLSACRSADISVPEQIAVIGVDDDPLLCDFCQPTLSSITLNPEAIGFMAAEILDLWMNGTQPESKEILVPPVGLTLRESSDIIAVDDPVVVTALRIIRESACDGLTVDEILKSVDVSRSALERRFRRFVDHSPQIEIRLVQIKRAKKLLSETDFPLQRIAAITGFEHPEYLSVVFKRLTGQTPGEYRKRDPDSNQTCPGGVSDE